MEKPVDFLGVFSCPFSGLIWLKILSVLSVIISTNLKTVEITYLMIREDIGLMVFNYDISDMIKAFAFYGFWYRSCWIFSLEFAKHSSWSILLKTHPHWSRDKLVQFLTQKFNSFYIIFLPENKTVNLISFLWCGSYIDIGYKILLCDDLHQRMLHKS